MCLRGLHSNLVQLKDCNIDFFDTVYWRLHSNLVQLKGSAK